jgi:adenylate cyclase
LFLISLTTTGQYKDRNVTAQQVGRELGVRHVLEGTVRRAGNRIRITAQLVETATGQPVWGERYDRTLDDLFDLQDEITEELVTALDVKLIHGEGHRIMRRSIKNPRARDIYYQALEALFTFQRDQVIEARRLLAEVSELEPDSPLAPVFSAFSHYFEASLDSGESAERSLDLAMEEAQKGIELARLAIRHSPLSPAIFPAVLATGHYLQGQHDEAVEAAENTVHLAPEILEAQVILAASLVASGRAEKAESVCREIFRIKADFDIAGFAATQPYKDRKMLEALIAHLQGAGLT